MLPQISQHSKRGRRRRSCESLFGEDVSEFPSSQWESINEYSYKLFFTPGPPPKLPEIPKREPGASNNPHGKNAYHIWKINKKKVCDVRSSLQEEGDEGAARVSEHRSAYTRQTLPLRELSRSHDSPAHNIVPENNVERLYDERMLPACAKVSTMTTAPPLQYTGRKRKTKAPYDDSGVFYGDNNTTTEGASVSSLCGMQFSRRKLVDGHTSSLHVKGFDGGAGAERPSGGLRTGYWQSRQYLKLR